LFVIQVNSRPNVPKVDELDGRIIGGEEAPPRE